MNDFSAEIEASVEVLRNGGTVLFPTETGWAVGCDATNEDAALRVRHLEVFGANTEGVVLMADERDVIRYVAAPDLAIFDFLAEQEGPAVVLFEHPIGLPEDVLRDDGMVAVRLVRDEFCRHLVKRLRRPLFSMAAYNSCCQPSLRSDDVRVEIKRGIDRVAHWQREGQMHFREPQVIRWNGNGAPEVITPSATD